MIEEVVAVQEPNGYLNTYYVDDSQVRTDAHQDPNHRPRTLQHWAYAAGRHRLLPCHRRPHAARCRNPSSSDDFLMSSYGPAPKQPIVAGHPEIELALIELYRITGDKRQLDLAGYILQGDARMNLPEQRTIYMFSGTPFTARTKLEGHAVRAMYACCGATDYYMETGDPAYWKTLNALWDDMTATKMYVTGGVGITLRRRGFRQCVRTTQRSRLRRKLRSHRQHDVELAHAGCNRRSEIHRRDRTGAV